jgi:hypothetical protein
LAAPAVTGDTTITVSDATGMAVGDTLHVGTPAEQVTIASVAGSVITLKAPLTADHGLGDPVVRPAGGVTYQDGELTQDACAAGRELSFGKSSDPVVTGSGATPYASGLSPDGKLVAAGKSAPRFYGQPLVAWQPVASASQYEVQWSRKLYPWAPAGSKLTWGTSITLPLGPGTWYYRVRGLDFLMQGTKPQMSWSDPVRVVVTKPRFRVIH